MSLDVNFEKGEYIGSGAEGDVYNFTSNSPKYPSGVIKIYNLGSSMGAIKKIQSKYSIQEKYPDLFAKVYDIRLGPKDPTKVYVAMEKLDTVKLSKVLDLLQKEIRKILKDNTNPLKFNRPYKEFFNNYKSDFLQGIYEELSESDSTSFLDFIEEKLDSRYNKLFTQLRGYLEKLVTAPGLSDAVEFLDVHSNNIGLDSEGRIKMFDYVTLSDIKI
jgi:hypothetical protein